METPNIPFNGVTYFFDAFWYLTLRVISNSSSDFLKIRQRPQTLVGKVRWIDRHMHAHRVRSNKPHFLTSLR